MNELNILAIRSLNVTVIPYLVGVAQAPIILTEIGTSGRYTGHMIGDAGVYQLDFLANGIKIGTGEIGWNGTAEIRVSTAEELAAAVRNELATEMTSILTMLKTLKNKREIKKVGATWTLFVYDDDATTPILSKGLKDVANGEITDIAAGLLAVELASSV